jgi:capsid protein
MVIALALKSLDIPYSFYDESHTNYSGSRGAWLMYDQSADDKRQDLRDFLNRWVAWRLGMLIYYGLLELPSKYTAADLKWSWIARKVPWIDPLKEIQAAQQEVAAGFNSTVGIAESMGLDAYDICDQQRDYLDYRVNVCGLPPPSAGATQVTVSEQAEAPKGTAA